MRLLIQKVKSAQVSVAGAVCGAIGEGLLVFLGIHKEDVPATTTWLVQKLLSLRIFPNPAGKLDRDIVEVGGEILIVSQFTLYGACDKGRRPDFTAAALPEPAFALYEQFIQELTTALGKPVPSGIFGASMEVSLINAGPATFLLER